MKASTQRALTIGGVAVGAAAVVGGVLYATSSPASGSTGSGTATLVGGHRYGLQVRTTIPVDAAAFPVGSQIDILTQGLGVVSSSISADGKDVALVVDYVGPQVTVPTTMSDPTNTVTVTKIVDMGLTSTFQAGGKRVGGSSSVVAGSTAKGSLSGLLAADRGASTPKSSSAKYLAGTILRVNFSAASPIVSPKDAPSLQSYLKSIGTPWIVTNLVRGTGKAGKTFLLTYAVRTPVDTSTSPVVGAASANQSPVATSFGDITPAASNVIF